MKGELSLFWTQAERKSIVQFLTSYFKFTIKYITDQITVKIIYN